MYCFLTEQQIEFKNLAKEVAETVVKPSARISDEKQEVPMKVIKELYNLGFGSIIIDEKYGGMGGSFLDFAIIIEEISKICAATALTLIGSMLGALPIILFGSEEQKKRYLPKIANGEYIVALAISESGAGSDIASMKTVMKLTENSCILNGRKSWITNGGIAQLYVVIVKGEKINDKDSFSAVIIEDGCEGLSFGKKENKIGMRSSATSEVNFDNCEVPLENIIGNVGDGIKIALKSLDMSRPIIAAQALGISEGSYEDALNYSKKREQFNRSISTFQVIQHMLADMYIKVETSKLLLYKACYMIDNHKDNVTLSSALSKVACTDIAMSITTDAVQIFGGYGCTTDYPVEKRMRDAKITQIYEGTNQLLKNIIAKEILRSQ